MSIIIEDEKMFEWGKVLKKGLVGVLYTILGTGLIAGASQVELLKDALAKAEGTPEIANVVMGLVMSLLLMIGNWLKNRNK